MNKEVVIYTTPSYVYIGRLSGEESACNAGAVAGATGSIPGLGRRLRDGNANPLSILAWEIPWTEEPVEFMGSRKGWTQLSNYTTTSVCVCVCVCVCVYNGILLSHTKEQNHAICSNMDTTGDYHAM